MTDLANGAGSGGALPALDAVLRLVTGCATRGIRGRTCTGCGMGVRGDGARCMMCGADLDLR